MVIEHACTCHQSEKLFILNLSSLAILDKLLYCIHHSAFLILVYVFVKRDHFSFILSSRIIYGSCIKGFSRYGIMLTLILLLRNKRECDNVIFGTTISVREPILVLWNCGWVPHWRFEPKLSVRHRSQSDQPVVLWVS